MPSSTLLYVAILPFAVAAVAAFVSRAIRLERPVVWAAGTGLGYIAAQVGLDSRGNVDAAMSSLLHPSEAVEWLPHAVLLALLVTILFSYLPRPCMPAAVVAAAVLMVGLPLRLLAGSIYDTQWSLAEKLGYIPVIAAALGITWMALSSGREGEHPRLRPVLLIIATAVGAVVIALSGALVYGELCGAVSAALAGTFTVAWATSNDRIDGTAGPLTFSFMALIVLGYFYAELALGNAVLLALATLLAAVRMPVFVASRPAWQSAAIRIGLTLLPLTVAVVQTVIAFGAGVGADPYGL